MDPILDGLNSAQRAAVSSPAPILQVLAPPGSGKTKTLTARVAYLLSHYGYRPQDVICCTFTIKASREMRERIARLIGDDVQSKLILGTFHSICRRYLVGYGHLIGLQKGFGIADSGDSLAIIKRIVKRFRLNILPNTARARISHQKAHGVSPAELAARVLAQQQHTKILEQQEFVKVYREYEMTLAASNLLDYDDLLLRCADLLRQHPQCVSNVQAVLVDEFQDTNHIQYELMNLFASRHKRITVVGDPDQSIYGFRSAEIKNLARMQKLYRDTSVVLLEDNYRSSASILNSAQDVIEQDVSRPAKKLQPTHCVGTLPVLRKLPTAAAEAEWLVLEIKRCIAMTGNLFNYSDFAILLRSASLSRQIESELGKGGVPYRMVGGYRFFDRVEIKLLLDYLRVVSHTGNSDALLRIINVPPRSIGEATVKLLASGAEEANVPLWNFVKDVAQGHRSTKKSLLKSADQGLRVLVGLVETCRQKLLECNDSSAPRKLLELVIRKLSFREYLTATYPLDEDNRWANVEELLCQAEDTATSGNAEEQDESLPEIQGVEQQQAHPGEEALARFLANVALSTEVTPQEGAEGGEQTQEKVTISTIHAAKGLEWPVVFVPAVYEGIIPHSRAEDSDEERRLLYVAMTRAQALLYLSYPRRQQRNNNTEETTPTSFLPSNIIEARFRPTGPNFHENVVYEIADILHRTRPSVEEMLKGLDLTPRARDDKWTADGDDPPDAAFIAALDEEGPYPKRRRCDQHPSSAMTTTTYISSSAYTLSNPPDFSVPTTLPAGFGFSTAREYITSNNPNAKPELTLEPRSDSKPPKSTSVAPTRKATGLSQESISRFFSGQPLFSSKDRNNPNESKSRSTNQSHQGSRSNEIGQANNKAVRTLPPNLSTHRLRPQPLLPSRPTLEPSDPNRYMWLSSSSSTSKPVTTTTTMPILQNKTQQNGEESSCENPPHRTGEIGNHLNQINAETGKQNTTTTTTYYTTTMSMLRQAASTTATGRKTLGIRRSMNGWEERMNRERTARNASGGSGSGAGSGSGYSPRC